MLFRGPPTMLRWALWHCARMLVWLIELWERIARSISPAAAPIRCPRVVAIAVDSRAQELHELAQILLCLASFGARHVALYDKQGFFYLLSDAGSLKLLGGQLEKRVRSIQKSSLKLKFSHKYELPNCVKSKNGEKDALIVELLSIEDGKASIAQAAQSICREFSQLPQAQQHKAVDKLCETDVDSHIRREAAHGKPDPELLLVFGSNSLQGFPPWRIKLTEIIYMGPLQNASISSLQLALQDFSGRTQRHGK